MSLKDARERLRDAQALKEQGIHPLEHKKEQKLNQSQTVKTLVEAWYKNYIEKNRKQPLQVKQQINADIIPLLGDRALETLKTREITTVLDKIVNRGAPSMPIKC